MPKASLNWWIRHIVSLGVEVSMGFISIIQLLKKTDGKAGRLLPALIRVPLLVLQRR